MATAFPSSSNTYVPSFDATGHLVIAYSREPKKFALNQYASLVPVKKDIGYYLRVSAEVAGRIIHTDLLRDFVWHDAEDAPSGDWGNEAFEFMKYATQRYAFPFRLGYKANEQADWKILALHSAFAAQLAMTARTIKAQTELTTAGSYDTGHSDTATNWGGGFLSAGTPTAPYVKAAFAKATRQIEKATLAAVSGDDLVAVMNPVLADSIARSQEVHTYLKESPAALAQVRGDVESQNGKYGLPDHLYGVRIVIENAVKVTSKKGATKATSYVQADNDLFLLARPGSQTSIAGGPQWSALTIFAYEEMTVETRDDPDHRRIAGRVVEDNAIEVTAPASLVRMTNCLS